MRLRENSPGGLCQWYTTSLISLCLDFEMISPGPGWISCCQQKTVFTNKTSWQTYCSQHQLLVHKCKSMVREKYKTHHTICLCGTKKQWVNGELISYHSIIEKRHWTQSHELSSAYSRVDNYPTILLKILQRIKLSSLHRL